MNALKKYFVPGLLVFCSLLLAFWQVMSWASRRAYEPFGLTPDKLASFQPVIADWTVKALPVISHDTMEANIAAYSVIRENQPSNTSRMLVRLVHGYNMPMCMKMKYYTVEKIKDNRVRPVTDPKLQSAFRKWNPESRTQNPENSSFPSRLGENPSFSSKSVVYSVMSMVSSNYTLPVQLWRLTSNVGTVSIWATTIIRGDDFTPTSEDICSMAFPRVDIPDDPNWVPRGLGVDDLKHPVYSFKRWLRGRWDGARWDVLAFLKLRRRVRTSEELLSFVSRVDGLSDNVANERDILELLETHAAILKELQKWRQRSEGAPR